MPSFAPSTSGSSLARPSQTPASASSSTAPASAPTATRFPLSFAVHESSSASSAPLSSTLNTSAFHSLGRTVAARAVSHTALALTTRLAWVEQLSAGPASLHTLREALPELDAGTWADLLEERHAAGLCPYPACARAAGRGYVPGAAEAEVKVKLRGGGLVQQTKKASAYCSGRCEERSEWAGGMVGTERRELMEDIEDRRKQLADQTRQLAAKTPPQLQLNPPHSASDARPALPLPPLPTSDPSATADLLTALQVTERPTPPTAPSAPSLTATDFESSATPTSASSPASLSTRSRPNRPAGLTPASSLLPFDPTNLTKTLLDANKALSSAPGANVRTPQPTKGLGGMAPPKWTSDPAMVDRAGRQVEWASVDEDGETDEVREMMELALASRQEALREMEMVESLERRIEAQDD